MKKLRIRKQQIAL